MTNESALSELLVNDFIDKVWLAYPDNTESRLVVYELIAEKVFGLVRALRGTQSSQVKHWMIRDGVVHNEESTA